MPGENEGPLPGTGPGVNAQVACPRSQHCPRGPSPQGLLRSLCPHAPEALSSPGCPFPLGLPSSCSKSLLCVYASGIVNFIQTLQVAVCHDCLLKVLPQVLPGGSKGQCTELGCAVCDLHSCMPRPAQLYAAASSQRTTCLRTRIRGLLPGRVFRQSLCTQY